LLLVIGEMLDGGSDGALLPAVAVQPRDGTSPSDHLD
jgi:hypothetical protein